MFLYNTLQAVVGYKVVMLSHASDSAAGLPTLASPQIGFRAVNPLLRSQ